MHKALADLRTAAGFRELVMFYIQSVYLFICLFVCLVTCSIFSYYQFLSQGVCLFVCLFVGMLSVSSILEFLIFLFIYFFVCLFVSLRVLECPPQPSSATLQLAEVKCFHEPLYLAGRLHYWKAMKCQDHCKI